MYCVVQQLMLFELIIVDNFILVVACYVIVMEIKKPPVTVKTVQTVGRITYIVLVQTLNHAQSIKLWKLIHCVPKILTYSS